MAAKAKRLPNRSKPSKAFAAAMRHDNNATVVKTAVVSALRWDGSVNLRLGGQRFLAVACASSYADRQTGDRVQVIMHGGMPFVLGSVGGDPDISIPEFFPSNIKQFTWGREGRADRETQMFVNEGDTQRIGRQGSTFPVFEGDHYYQAVFSYWDGVQNTLLAEVDGTEQSMDLFVARDDWDEGDPGPARLTLWAHKMDAIPGDPQTILYQTSLDPEFIDFTLEAGESKIIQIPDPWRDNIGVAPHTTETIRGFTITPASAGGAPYAVDNSYAILTNLTCGFRAYKT